MSQTEANSNIAQLSQFALITASGADAVSFLQSQLTNDIKLLAENHACLAGYCTPKGRLLATMLIWKVDDTITMEVPKELQENLQKRLQMYVMRAKVKLEHVSNTRAVFGILGASAVEKLAAWFPTAPASPYELVNNDSGTLIRVTDVDGMARYQCIVSNEIAAQMAPLAHTESDWALSEIHAGIPHITVATQEKFVPQMINYELIGGVNFKKGCYPGQEIVARTHYLGKQKRRTVLARIDSATVQSGMEVFATTDLTQPCGMVVNAALNKNGGSDCLIEIKTAFLTDTTVQLSSGETCHWLAMPYSLPDDAAQAN
jgi:folate-binding protein YgfZ